jgi:manganese/zinc/iron transport system substrate-binding protein
MKTRFLLFVLVTIFYLVSCTPTPKRKYGKPQVVTTTGMIADLVRNIGGDSLEVVALMGPGVDPHLYKATQGDLKKLTDADLILYNGLFLEGKMGEVFDKLSKNRPVYALGEGLPKEFLRSHPIYPDAHDPHLWFDVAKWSMVATYTTEILSKHYPYSAAYFQANSTRYLAELNALHSWVKEEIAQISEPQRVLITAHDAFGYFGDTYGMEVRGLQGISTLSEYGLKDITNLVDFIVSRQIKAVFIETSVSERSIQAVVEGCKQKGWEVRIGGSLYSDAMGAAGGPAGTYSGMVKSNVNTITQALK